MSKPTRKRKPYLTESQAWCKIARAFSGPRPREGISKCGLCYALHMLGANIADKTYDAMRSRLEQHTSRNCLYSCGYAWPLKDRRTRAKVARQFAREAKTEEGDL